MTHDAPPARTGRVRRVVPTRLVPSCRFGICWVVGVVVLVLSLRFRFSARSGLVVASSRDWFEGSRHVGAFSTARCENRWCGGVGVVSLLVVFLLWPVERAGGFQPGIVDGAAEGGRLRRRDDMFIFGGRAVVGVGPQVSLIYPTAPPVRDRVSRDLSPLRAGEVVPPRPTIFCLDSKCRDRFRAVV
ncbi:MAG: hypothetical protein M0R06_00770 [Sphaerochaeta sp.]|nr:hypothetical protein [Sphaerochaeta sp.]